jgi:hypothetical protein
MNGETCYDLFPNIRIQIPGPYSEKGIRILTRQVI